jgi:hypothetical protein
MSHSAMRRTLPPVQSLRRLRVRPSWWRPLPWVVLLGLLAILRVSSQARLTELDWESRRLDRLVLEQQMRRGELLRERARLTSNERLSRIAAAEGMVPPSSVKPIELGALPQTKIYWELPDESGRTGALNGQQLGQLVQPPAPRSSASP